ncbi:cell wall anchor protein, partial [Rodentibacter pneumotropicus]
MSTTLKVLSAKKVIASHQINQGDTLVIDARDKSNYQLIDDQTGFGPQNIIAKREGKDLKIFLEDGDMNPDVLIKGYYGDENSEEVTNLIVGQHENGGIYAYVPESGLKSDAVSMLAEEVAAPQALGGEELASAFWAFNPWWLLALVPLAAGIAIAASHGGSSGSGNNGNNDATADKPEITANDDGSVTVKPGNDNTKVDVKFKDEDGNDKTVTAEKGSDGKWKLPENDDSGATIDPDTGVITIPADKVKDGETVNAKGTDDKGNTADADAKTAGNNPTTPRIPGDVDGDGNADDDDNDATTEKGAPKVTIPEATDGVNAEEAK